MQLVDRIEKRRFVGREFLLWLWFESEAFEATLSTKVHGTFGLWIERHLVLSVGKEATRIKGTFPAGSREAKEALALGKLPESAGLHLAWGDRDITFTLKAERLSLSGLSLPTVLGGHEEEAPALLAARPPPRRKKRAGKEALQETASDERHESFYERMQLTREVEGLVEALYRDFLTLRLGPAWTSVVEPAFVAWIAGAKAADLADQYRKDRANALSPRPRKVTAPQKPAPRRGSSKRP